MNNEVISILTDKDSIYFSTTKEFVHGIFHNSTSAHPLTVNILSATANDSSIAQYNYTLEPTQNNIAIQLECPSINATDEPVYYYAILNRNQKDTLWNISSSRNLSFNALLPGDYNILFKAIDKSDNSKQSNIQNIAFTIKDYFYKTWYFIVGVFSLISFIIIITIVSINKFRQNRIRKELENESKINELKLQGLLSQMNPHFLFNSLNVIQKYITSKDEEHALSHLSDFSHLMREILNQTRRGTISLEEEVEFLERYVKLEKPRFDNDFEFIIENNIEEDAHEIRIPPMLIQPLIENAIKHGVSNMKTERGQIRATFNLLNESLLQVIIADNGTYRGEKKSSKKTHQSHALNIIKERVTLLSKEKSIGSFELNIFEIGASAVLNIPI
jgi:uncharacterized membrane protein